MLEQGATYGTQNSQIWAPYYTLHKILAGLLDCYEVGGNRKALEIARDMGGWVHARLKVLPTETRISMWNRYIAGEYGGMNEVLARLYRLTGERSIPRDGQAVRQHQLLLRQRRARSRPGQERRHDPRQARQPAHPPDHRGAGDLPRHAGTPVLPDRRQFLAHGDRQLHVQHRRRRRGAQPEQRRVLHRRARHAV